MYGGIVTYARTHPNGSKDVYVDSWTKWNPRPAGRLGFKIRYGHLESFSVAEGDVVKKGQVIGLTGTTGTWAPHLHVDLKAFNDQGVITTEECPLEINLAYHKDIAAPAQRIKGFMNFACFLPADVDADGNEIPAITQARLDEAYRRNRGKRELLSVRTAAPYNPESLVEMGFVPVYTSKPNRYSGVPLESDWLPHSKIGCYVILEEDTIDNHKFYRIQWEDDREAWVPSGRRVLLVPNVEIVQVEEASIPPLPTYTFAHTKKTDVTVYRTPYQTSRSTRILGNLDSRPGLPHQRYL